MLNCKATALDAVQAGLSVIPIAPDGSKRPLIKSWKEFQTRIATIAEVEAWFTQWPDAGLAVVSGEVSGNLEIGDYDVTEIYRAYRELAESSETGLIELFRRVLDGYMETSPKGVHILYRCPVIAGNTKLATRPERDQAGEIVYNVAPNGKKTAKIQTLIETRGEGGYCIIAPSGGKVHPTGRPYESISGYFHSIVTIAPTERKMLLDLARTFHEATPDDIEGAVKRIERVIDGRDTTSDGLRPGDDFNQRATWAEVLESAGWVEVRTHQGKTFWRRPGKNIGISGVSDEGKDGLFKCFSSSTAFDSSVNHAYNKFTAYALLNHNGDASAAAKDLASKGFGKTKRLFTNAPVDLAKYAIEARQIAREKIDSPILQEPDYFEEFPDPTEPLGQTAPNQTKPEKPTEPKKLYHIDELVNIPPPTWLIEGELQRDSIAMLAGESGIGKTFIALDMALNVAETEDVVYISSEGGGSYSERTTAWRSHHQKRANHFYYWSESLQPHIPEILGDFLTQTAHLKPALIVVDTLARSAVGLEENSAKDMGLFATGLDAIRKATGATILVIHHTTKNGGWERGSSALKGFIDTLITVSGDKDNVKVECRKQRGAPEFEERYVTWLQVGTCRVPVSATGETQIKTTAGKVTDSAKKVLAALNNSLFEEIGATSKQLYDALGMEKTGSKTKAVYNVLGQLKTLGYISQGAKGEPYKITTAGKDIIEPQTL